MADDAVTALSLVAPLGPEALEEVHDLVQELFDGAGVTDMQDQIRFETAVIEIGGNILQHSTRTDPPGTDRRSFDILLRGDDVTLTAEFRDNGRPVVIDFEKISMPGEDAEAGRGLAIALAAVDDVTHERHEGMNIWRITCHRSR